MKGRNRESQGDLVRDRSRVVTNTKYAGKHGCAEVSWETPSVCGESSRHRIEHSVEANGADRLFGVCKNGDDCRFLHNATGEEEVAPEAILTQVRNGHIVPTFG